MSETPPMDLAAEFVSAALEREGALLEPGGSGALLAVLPEELSASLGLQTSVALRVSGSTEAGETSCPLEGPVVQWLADRARGRGRFASARLDLRAPGAARCAEGTRQRLTLPNAMVLDVVPRATETMTVVVEFAYEARAAERTSGTLAVAVPAGEAPPSLSVAESILPALEDARAEAPAVPAEALGPAIRRAGPLAEAEVRRRLAPFLDLCARRMAVEEEQVRAYHDRLAMEAGRRRGRPSTREGTGPDDKREAILRARDERLRDVAARHAVDAALTIDGVLLATYPVVQVVARVRRRRREISVPVLWDPLLPDPIGPTCDGCRRPTLSLHVCDDQGHVTCAACARGCGTCGRVTCRGCSPQGCRCASGSS